MNLQLGELIAVIVVIIVVLLTVELYVVSDESCST
jgi:hypothetical protein